MWAFLYLVLSLFFIFYVHFDVMFMVICACVAFCSLLSCFIPYHFIKIGFYFPFVHQSNLEDLINGIFHLLFLHIGISKKLVSSILVTYRLFVSSSKLALRACVHDHPSISPPCHIIVSTYILFIFGLIRSYDVMLHHFKSFRNHFIAYFGLRMKILKFDPCKNWLFDLSFWCAKIWLFSYLYFSIPYLIYTFSTLNVPQPNFIFWSIL